jgi:hypothetical protein
VVVKAVGVVEVEVVDPMTPNNLSSIKKSGMSLLVQKRGCSLI